MRILLIANTLFEFVVGLTMIFAPVGLLQGSNQPVAIALARVLGCNAFALGILSLLMLQNLTKAEQIRSGLIVFAVFHTAVTIAQIFNLIDRTTALPVVIVHSLFALSFLYFLKPKNRL